jgi:hypothetical protein
MKDEFGYYIVDKMFPEIKVPIYGLRPVPKRILQRCPQRFGDKHWQVEIWSNLFGEYVWINQSRDLIFFH